MAAGILDDFKLEVDLVSIPVGTPLQGPDLVALSDVGYRSYPTDSRLSALGEPILLNRRSGNDRKTKG